METSQTDTLSPMSAPRHWTPLDSALEHRTGIIWSVALLMMGLGAWLRFHGLDSQSLWFDEILQARITCKPLGWILAHMPHDKPPLDYWLQHFAIRWGGETDWWIRFPSAMWASLTLPVAFLWARSMFGATVGLIALLLLATSPLHIHYAQEGRPYALFTLASALVAWSLWELTRSESGRWRWWLIHVLSLLVSLWTLYLTLVSLGLLLLWLGALLLWVVIRKRSDRRRLTWTALTALGIAAVGIASLFPLAGRVHAELGQTFHRPFSLHSLGDLGRFLGPLVFGHSENQGFPGALWMGLPVILLGAGAGLLRRSMAMALLLVLCAGTVGGMLLFHWRINHWLEVRYLLGALLPWLMIEAIGIGTLVTALSLPAPRVHRPAMAGTLLVITVICISVFSVHHILVHPHRKMNWRLATEWLSENAQPGQRILLVHPWHQIRLDYYLERSGATIATEVHPDPKNLQARAMDLGDCWVLLTADTEAPVAIDWLLGHPSPWTGAEGIRIWHLHDPEAWYQRRPGRIATAAERFAADDLRIEIGRESFAAIGMGWGEAERFNDEHPFRWTLNERASLLIPLDSLDEMSEVTALLFRAMTYDFPNARPQITSVRINGIDIGWGVIIPGWQVYAMHLPPGALRTGLNRLEFEIDHAVSPSEIIDVPDPRRLGIGIDWVVLGGSERLSEADHIWSPTPPEGWIAP